MIAHISRVIVQKGVWMIICKGSPYVALMPTCSQLVVYLLKQLAVYQQVSLKPLVVNFMSFAGIFGQWSVVVQSLGGFRQTLFFSEVAAVPGRTVRLVDASLECRWGRCEHVALNDTGGVNNFGELSIWVVLVSSTTLGSSTVVFVYFAVRDQPPFVKGSRSRNAQETNN